MGGRQSISTKRSTLGDQLLSCVYQIRERNLEDIARRCVLIHNHNVSFGIILFAASFWKLDCLFFYALFLILVLLVANEMVVGLDEHR